MPNEYAGMTEVEDAISKTRKNFVPFPGVDEWLTKLNYGQYSNAFHKEEVDSLAELILLTKKDLIAMQVSAADLDGMLENIKALYHAVR